MKQSTIPFSALKIGDEFECYGDTCINYDYPKICRCRKLDETTAEEIDGIRFLINPNDLVFELMTSNCSSGKISYGRSEANRVKNSMTRFAKVKPRRTYFCDECRQWHITSNK